GPTSASALTACRSPWRRRRGARERPHRLLVASLAGGGRRGDVRAARRVDGGRGKGGGQNGGPRGFLSQPARGPRGPPAAAGASQALHLGTSRSPAAAARVGDPRQPHRGRLAPAAGGEPMAQPAHV